MASHWQGFSPGLPPPSPASSAVLTPEFETTSATFSSCLHTSADRHARYCWQPALCKTSCKLSCGKEAFAGMWRSAYVFPCRSDPAAFSVDFMPPSLCSKSLMIDHSPTATPNLLLDPTHVSSPSSTTAESASLADASSLQATKSAGCNASKLKTSSQPYTILQTAEFDPDPQDLPAQAASSGPASPQSAADNRQGSAGLQQSLDDANSILLPGHQSNSSSITDQQASFGRSPAAKVTGVQPLQKAPKGNSVKQYHRLSSMQGVVFYQQLEVIDEYGHQHCFAIGDQTQGALVSLETAIQSWSNAKD